MSCKNKTVNGDILPADTRCQIILPCISWAKTVVIMQCHEDGHPKTGTSLVPANLSTNYCIVSAREVTREFERDCVLCRRRKAKRTKR